MLLWHVSFDSVWLLQSCLLFQLMKEKSVWWNQEKTECLGGIYQYIIDVGIDIHCIASVETANRFTQRNESILYWVTAKLTLKFGMAILCRMKKFLYLCRKIQAIHHGWLKRIRSFIRSLYATREKTMTKDNPIAKTKNKKNEKREEKNRLRRLD